MKSILLHRSLSLVLLLGLALGSCQKKSEGPANNPDADKIDDLIANLSYDANAMLNVQSTTGGSTQRTLTSENNSSSTVQGTQTICTTKEYNLKANFEDVAILRPTNGIIWPGALVVGNQSMLDGLPDPLTMERAPVDLRVDLPGIGTHGNLHVTNPANTTVQASIDEALEWWNGNAYQDGYVNAANSSYQATASYSSQQMSLDLGLNVEWASGDVATQFSYSTTSTKRVAMMVFKQVFYTISMDAPPTPASVFGPSVTLEQVQNKINSSTPPAYVQSVSYGRILMFRMETTAQATEGELTGAFNYASGLTNASGTIEAKYKQILQQATITSVMIGGNAAVASQAVTASSFGDLAPIITGDNAVYSRNNPGVPISYVIRYLKDNSFAKMGYTTDYSTNTCTTNSFVNESIKFTNNEYGWSRIRLVYKGQNSNTEYTTSWVPDIEQYQSRTLYPPNGAWDVRIQHEFKYVGCVFGACYQQQQQLSFGTIPSRKCVVSVFNNGSGMMQITTVSPCN